MSATTDQLDIYLGYFWTKLKVEDENRKKSLGSRHTPVTLKQMKTDLENLKTYVWKRKEKLADATFFSYFQAVYDGKKLKYDKVPQLCVEGERKRKLIMPADLELRDAWMMQDPRKVERPTHLLLMVGTILMEADASRGTGVLKQIRRSYFTPLYDGHGNLTYRVKGLVSRKTSGRGSKPMNFLLSGQHEVYVIRTLLEVLPPPDCQYCVLASPPVPRGQSCKCVCDKIFLCSELIYAMFQHVWFDILADHEDVREIKQGRSIVGLGVVLVALIAYTSFEPTGSLAHGLGGGAS